MKYPKNYYASKKECYSMPHLRSSSPNKAVRKGVLGWRSFINKPKQK